MRPSQGTHKTQQKEIATGGGRRRLTEVPWSLNCQKSGEGRLGEDRWKTAGGMDQQDGTGRA